MEQKGIKIITYQSPLYFANGDIFVKEVYRLSTVKPERLRKQIRRASEISRRASMVSNSSIGLTNANSRRDSSISTSSSSSDVVKTNYLAMAQFVPCSPKSNEEQAIKNTYTFKGEGRK